MSPQQLAVESENGFLYFLEGHTGQVTQSHITALGLEYAFDAKPVSCRCQGGPSSNSGVVFARNGAIPGNVGYYPQSQQWQKSADGDFWVGWIEARPPGPEHLAKSKQLPGNWITLNDGNEWHCPIARSVADCDDSAGFLIVPRVPQTIKRMNGDWVVGDIIQPYRELWDTANRVFAAFLEALDDSAHTQDVTFDDCVCALAANYFIGPDEASILELFTSTGPEMWEVLSTLMDRDSYLDWGKKKLAHLDAAASTSPGE